MAHSQAKTLQHKLRRIKYQMEEVHKIARELPPGWNNNYADLHSALDSALQEAIRAVNHIKSIVDEENRLIELARAERRISERT